MGLVPVSVAHPLRLLRAKADVAALVIGAGAGLNLESIAVGNVGEGRRLALGESAGFAMVDVVAFRLESNE